MTAGICIPITRLDLRYVPRPWDFARERRAEIDAYFETLKSGKDQIWNGQVLLLHEHRLERGTFSGSYLQTDFASFIAWRDWGFPDTTMRNCFAPGVIQSSDGAFLLGVMARGTANAGRIYFPAGTPDPGDIVNGTVDLERSVRREVAEETGLDTADLDIAPGWLMTTDGPRIAMLKRMRSRQPAAALQAQIRRTIAAQEHPELSDIRIVRGLADLDPAMPDFVAAFLRGEWTGREGRR